MATNNYILLWYLADSDGDKLTGPVCPIAFRDIDETVDWIEGTHIANGLWQFNIPSGLLSGLKIGVQTAPGVFTTDSYLSGTPSGDTLGLPLVPIEKIST